VAGPLDPIPVGDIGKGVTDAANQLVGLAAVRVGVDLVEISRIASALERPGFATRCFTSVERDYCELATNSAERYAARFSAKEAVLKALGVGLGGVPWHDIEVARKPSGEPELRVTGKGAELAQSFGIERWLITMTHSKTSAHALVVGIGRSDLE
jgi:holo-[acyl-carrier protein] synthase